MRRIAGQKYAALVQSIDHPAVDPKPDSHSGSPMILASVFGARMDINCRI